MSDIINLNEKRSKSKLDQLLKEPGPVRPLTAAEIRFNNAFLIFAKCSNLGKKRQRDFLYEILSDFRFERRTINLDEMAEKMVSYIHRHKSYFEKITGDSMEFDFDKVPDAQEIWTQFNIGVPKRKKARLAAPHLDK